MRNFQRVQEASDIDSLIVAFRNAIVPNYSELLQSGKSILSASGIENLSGLAEQCRENIELDITTSSLIKGLIKDVVSGEKSQERMLIKISKMIKATDVYWYLNGKKDKTNKVYNIYREIEEIRNEDYTRTGKLILDNLSDFLYGPNSMSTAEARDLASKSRFSQAAFERISRQRKGDYKGRNGISKLTEDAAEFYRMINFTGQPINYIVTDDRQSFEHTRRVINVGKALDRNTLWHELAHSIEYDHPEVLAMTKEFLRKRLEESTNGMRQLRSIYKEIKHPNANDYDPTEVTIDDGAYSPYVTKFYNLNNPLDIDGARSSEVLSMGLECLMHDHKALGMMAINDPEHLEFILSVIAHLRAKYQEAKQ